MSNKIKNKQAVRLAYDLRCFLLRHDLWHDCMIFFDEVAFTSRDNRTLLEGESANPKHYFDYVAEPHILSMCFEGRLYELINHRGSILLEKFNAIFEKHGVYYELGNAWNLTCFANS